LDFEPGTNYSYSNLAYDVLGFVVERVSGQTFEEYVKTNILIPNKMIQSDFRYFKIPDSLRTYPHSKNWFSKNIYQRNTYPYTREHAPSSTLNSSAMELSRWMISFIKKLYTEKEPYYFHSMIMQSTNLNKYIGLGFQLNTIEGQKTIGHFGGDKGFRSYLLMIPDKKIGTVVLSNCDYSEDFRQEIIHYILKIMLASLNQ
jgi:CubicO group peptidase (beta-lactamase class C family)